MKRDTSAGGEFAMRGRGVLLGVMAAVLVTAGCASTHSVSKDLDVTREPDRFRIRIGSLENFTDMLEYDWTSAGSIVAVSQVCDLTGGDAHFEIRDPSGLVIHSRSLRTPGTSVTAAGQPGVWKMRLDLRKATGSVDVTVREP
jgi:hypothetical protein